MSDSIPNGWEPDSRQVGKNWTDMFRDPQRDGPPLGPPTIQPTIEEPPDDESPTLDLAEYKPWILQRARTRPALMLELRRYEPRSGLWSGWAMAYHSLHAVDYVGDRLLTLDFGARQFAVEGHGLDALVQRIQQGTVLGIIEHHAALWPKSKIEAIVTAIRRVEAPN